MAFHFIGDFVFQTDWMALNKSKRNWPLTVHILVYTAVIFTFGVFILGDVVLGLYWAVINGLIHWGVDWITSRLTSYFWEKKDRHMFFVVIGADQFVHYWFLFATWEYIFRNTLKFN